MNMLTSGSQYLRPDYLTPLPTTLDAKKSPLALLAQTCSNIGADTPNNKPLIPPIEKPKDSDKCKDKSSVPNEDKSSFKPYESSKKDENSVDSDKRTPTSKTSSPAIISSSPAGSVSASSGKNTPSAASENNNNSSIKSESVTSSSATSTSASASLSSSSSISTNALSYCSSTGLGLDIGRTDPSSKDSIGSMSHLSLGAYKSGLNGSINPLANCVGCTPGHNPMDAVSMAHTFPGSIMSQSVAGLKPGSYPVGSALSPYVGYARVKTANGGTTLVPVCRDPFCTNCQLSMQSAQLSSCPSGCTQCTHERLAPSLAAAAAVAAANQGLSGLNSGLMPNLASMPGLGSQLYSHSMLPRPNVCSWMVGDTYCGKRFATSEELLQHLRTHTNLSAADNGSVPLMSPTLSVPSQAALSAACHLHYSTSPSLTTPAGLRRTYPTSLSPVSSLSASAANRYHPYKAPLPTFPGGPPMAPLPHPALGMYYSPYSFYGQRLGPPVHP